MTISPLITKFLETVRVKTPVAGFEISDSTIRFAVPGPGRWDVYSQRLPLGAVVDGVIADEPKFKEAVAALKKSVAERYGRKKIPVIVSLVSSQIYTQAFPLPIVQETEADKVIDLNLKMISPLKYDDVYAGWQYVKKDNTTSRFEVLGAFLKRSTVHEIERVLEGSGVRPLALEPRSLSLARLIRKLGAGSSKETPVAVLSVDDEGINFLVVKEGQLYFEYTELWKNLYDPGKSITIDEFRAAVKRSVQQLVNFYSQRWPEPLGEFLIIAPNLVPEVQKILTEDFAFPARELVFTEGKNIGGEWFATIGAAWRGLSLKSDDEELSLLGHTARHIFGRERFVDFLSLWSLLVPLSLGMILLSMLAADFFIVRELRLVQESAAARPASGDRARLLALEAQAKKFNADVLTIQSMRKEKSFKGTLLDDILNRASSSGVAVNNLKLQANGSLTLAGSAASEDKIILFKNSLRDAGYQNIELPLSGIRKESQGYVFSMTFSLAS